MASIFWSVWSKNLGLVGQAPAAQGVGCGVWGNVQPVPWRGTQALEEGARCGGQRVVSQRHSLWVTLPQATGVPVVATPVELALWEDSIYPTTPVRSSRGTRPRDWLPHTPFLVKISFQLSLIRC